MDDRSTAEVLPSLVSEGDEVREITGICYISPNYLRSCEHEKKISDILSGRDGRFVDCISKTRHFEGPW